MTYRLRHRFQNGGTVPCSAEVVSWRADSYACCGAPFHHNSVPLHRLVLKHTVRYYGILERDKAAYCAVEQALVTAASQDHTDQLYFQLQHLFQLWWAADFIQSAVEDI